MHLLQRTLLYPQPAVSHTRLCALIVAKIQKTSVVHLVGGGKENLLNAHLCHRLMIMCPYYSRTWSGFFFFSSSSKVFVCKTLKMKYQSITEPLK